MYQLQVNFEQKLLHYGVQLCVCRVVLGDIDVHNMYYLKMNIKPLGWYCRTDCTWTWWCKICSLYCQIVSGGFKPHDRVICKTFTRFGETAVLFFKIIIWKHGDEHLYIKQCWMENMYACIRCQSHLVKLWLPWICPQLYVSNRTIVPRTIKIDMLLHNGRCWLQKAFSRRCLCPFFW